MYTLFAFMSIMPTPIGDPSEFDGSLLPSKVGKYILKSDTPMLLMASSSVIDEFEDIASSRALTIDSSRCSLSCARFMTSDGSFSYSFTVFASPSEASCLRIPP